MHDVINHYNKLIDENNDPVHDPKPLRQYMDKWDGPAFIEELQLSSEKTILEIGVGTGRIAVKTAPRCASFVGIDISPKTIERAKENLMRYDNVSLHCADFVEHNFTRLFDVIYSSLTFMHIKNKQTAIYKIAGLLKPGGRFVLSIEKNQSNYIDMGNRKVMIYPDKPDEIYNYMKSANLRVKKKFETEMAFILVAEKSVIHSPQSQSTVSNC